MERVICIVIGYLFGLFQTGYIYGRLHHVDIRQYGSGNAGTTNALRVLGKKAGIITYIGDCLKAVLAGAFVSLIFKDSHADMLRLLVFYSGLGVMLGHNYPCYLKFKGGKGVACTAGLIIFFHPYMVIPEIITFFGIFFTTHYVSLGSILVQFVLIAEMIVLGQTGVLGMEQTARNELYLVTVLLALLALWEHRENIKRLIHKEERKTYLIKKSESERQ